MQKEINKAKLIVSIVAAAVVIIILLGALFFCSDKKKKQLESMMLGSCVKIYTNIGYGSGMVYCINDDEVIVATAAHVLEGFDENARIEFCDGSSYSGLLCDVDEIIDVGIVSVLKSNISEETIKSIKEVNITQDAFTNEPSYTHQKSTEYCVMYDLFGENGIIKRVPGKVTSMSEYVYEYDRHMLCGQNADVTEGMSGCPIFTEDGYLLGMLQAGNHEGDFRGITYFNLVNR